jgi:two-component system cell cycle response regulator
VLLVSEQEWLARALEALVSEQSMVAVRAWAGRDALALGMGATADVVVSDTRLPDIAGVDLARAFQATSELGSALPVVLVSTDPPDRQAMLEALEAGVWDWVGFPFDAATLAARLRTFAAAKRRADRLRDESLLDRPTGVYSLHGLTRRARELGAGAQRLRTPMGCVAVAADVVHDGLPTEPPASEAVLLADLLRSASRASDVVGRTGASEFVVFTPGSGPEGTAAYVERLEAQVNSTPRGGGQAWRLRAVWCAADGVVDLPDPITMLHRTRSELRRLGTLGGGDTRVREVAYAASASG